MKLRAGSGAAAALLAAGLLALLAPAIAPAGPFRTSAHLLQAPGLGWPMGTDDLGRNVAVGVLYGARTSLLVAAGVAVIAGLLGLAAGSLAGFAGGAVDSLLMRAAELVWVLPRFFLAVATAALFGARLAPLVVLLGLVSWPGPARILRAAVRGQRRLQYVEAARSIGLPPVLILVRHVLPNSMAPFIVSVSLLAGNAILVEAGLAFLGLGDATNPSWGSMLRDAQPIMQSAPWALVWPAAAVSAAVLCFNLAGDAVVDALSPWRQPAEADTRTITL